MNRSTKAPRYLLHDRDHAFGHLGMTANAMGIEELLTAPRSPWQNAAEMDMVGTYAPFENFDVLTTTDFPDQIPDAVADLSDQDRLAILRGKHKMVVQTIDGVGRWSQFAHRRPSYRKPPEGVA